MTITEQLHSALSLTVGKSGHLPNCGHLQWLNGWSAHTRHECDVPDCRRTGQPCSRPCQQVRSALKLPIAATPPAGQGQPALFGGLL